MNLELVPLLHDLGLVTVINLHYKDGSVRTSVLRKTIYGVLWAYEREEWEWGSVRLGEDGTIKDYKPWLSKWTVASNK